MICVPTSLGSVDGVDFLMLWEEPALVQQIDLGPAELGGAP
jgi:hypothetical protein